ncbi:eEF1A lysine and N-terminal methyltransferase isoform X1 [Ambystoma mexicanum]|uniref:eEF1A lysine and N-terminal methyltransferase isoform X1 n=1 Tax=Ambystoma mexicanum TaxID=8296 RepID=UPI0037E853BC
MELLPRSSQEFASAQYWERFFRRRGPRSFEWYGGYTELCGVLHKYIKPRDKVLVIGCGNSELSEQMYDVGYEDLVNIDISEVVIKQMTERNAARRPKMAFQHMDMMAMHFSDSHFQVVLDKGTLDAVLTDEDEKTLKRVDQMFAEVCRVLPIGGRYICVSLAQDHILKKAVGYFCQEGWMVRVHQIGEHEGKYSAEPDAQFFMPVFVFVMTKFKKIPGSTLRILEICPNEQDKPLRMEDEGQLTEAVRERQRYALLRHQLSRSSATGDISLDLCDKESGKARYTFYIVDSPTVRAANSNHFAAFIIPQGRETEWLFGTEEGRKQLAGSAGYRRLIVVALHRDQLYHGMEGIQSELSTKVLELAPKGLPDNHQIPFLSASNDLGVRTVQHRGTSKQSGEYVIEDVKGDGPSFFRRLVFLTNRNVVQSEARLVPDTPCKVQKKKKKDRRKITEGMPAGDVLAPRNAEIDKSHLCCEHHKAMIAGLAVLKNPEQLAGSSLAMLVIGLGGGSLPLFIHDYFTKSHVDVVEIDPSMLEVACKWFAFAQGDRMKVHITDGLEYINNLAMKGDTSYNVIMFDVDSKDLSLGMSCPPPAFVEKDFLQQVSQVLAPEGIFILNLVCRDTQLKKLVLNVLREVFPLIYTRRIEEEVNEILFCRRQGELKLSPSELQEQAAALESQLKRPNVAWDLTYVLSDMLKGVQIV